MRSKDNPTLKLLFHNFRLNRNTIFAIAYLKTQMKFIFLGKFLLI